MHLAISAEAIPYHRCGLGHFLVSAIRELHAIRPEWRITLVAETGFEELRALANPKIKIIEADAQPLLVGTTALLGRILSSPRPHRQLAAAKLWSLAPWRALRRWGGDLPTLWAQTRADVVWVPHHTLVGTRNCLYQNLRGLNYPRLMTIHDLHPLFSRKIIRRSFCSVSETAFAPSLRNRMRWSP